jgi:hypothetical protein
VEFAACCCDHTHTHMLWARLQREGA